jgi:septal ring factor EnvC (AmiA/AmiB activator)
MASKFESKAAPIGHQLDLLLDEREKRTTQLEQTKESLDAAAAELNTFRNQYNEAKDIVAANREEKDKIARAWFRRKDNYAAIASAEQRRVETRGGQVQFPSGRIHFCERGWKRPH